jgi:hypothetical protein
VEAWSLRLRAVKVPRTCPLVLLVKVGWRPNIVLESEEGKAMGSGLLGGES